MSQYYSGPIRVMDDLNEIVLSDGGRGQCKVEYPTNPTPIVPLQKSSSDHKKNSSRNTAPENRVQKKKKNNDLTDKRKKEKDSAEK
ncbi:hypothetical protein [Microbulbifer sp. THAF38]|uniref:hypothetical protein n=1 Tax=Microbulbifer sp. THAF38 TaxID=2587856 RepID=UPI00126942AD|nr:hypothetical protein [Microbulbifer sp. THAF38]QFT56741.1 hypothetical protein FIU95_19505 [Microbulbifer sp. THAF38]